jgi:hypothetical protein
VDFIVAVTLMSEKTEKQLQKQGLYCRLTTAKGGRWSDMAHRIRKTPQAEYDVSHDLRIQNSLYKSDLSSNWSTLSRMAT